MSRSDARLLAVVLVAMFAVFSVTAVVLLIAVKRRRRSSGGSGGSGAPDGKPPEAGLKNDGPSRKLGALLGRAAAEAEQLAGPALVAVNKAANQAARAVDRALQKARDRRGNKPSSNWHWGGFEPKAPARVESFGPGGRRESSEPDVSTPPKPPSADRIPPVEVFGPDGIRPPLTPASGHRPSKAKPSAPAPLSPAELGPIDENRAAAALADDGWHVLKDAEVYGPLSLLELRTRLKDLGPQTCIWVKGYRTWVAASSVPGLLAA